MGKRVDIIGICAALVLALGTLAHPSGANAQDSNDRIWLESDSSGDQSVERPLTSATISSLVKDTSPAVVNIIVAYKGSELDAFLRGKSPLPGPNGGIGQGSGFLIHPDGYVLTNHHVVENAREIKVRLKDQNEYEAQVVGADPKTDIALMRIDADRDFPALPLGDSDETEVGNYVVAIGNPLGLHHTVTSGIVAALGRRNLGIEGDKLYTDFIQVDVSINPGNSGGPLVGLSGDVIGINTAINKQGQGIGFAIPINMVKTLLPQLKNQGYVTRSWLGARVQEVTPALAKSFNVGDAHGALVTEVVDDSPASKAGLKAGDIVVEFDGRKVRTSDQLPWMVSTAGADRTVDVEVVRKGESQSLDVELAEHPEQSKPDLPSAGESKESEGSVAQLDVKVKNLTESLARQLGASSKSGVVVTEIGEGSPAKGAGLRRRDVITEIDKQSIGSKNDFESAIERLESGEVIRFKLVRGGRVVYIAFER